MANDMVLAKASRSDHGTPAAQGGDTDRLVIERPESNVTHVIDIGQAKAIVFGFALDEVKIAIYDVDLVLVFPDGAKIILPGFALAIAGIEAGGADGLTIMAGGEEIDPQRLLAAVGETKIAEVTPLVSVTDLPQSTDDKQHSVETEQAAANGADAEAQGPGEAEPAPPPSPHKISDRDLLEDNPKVEEAPVEIRIPRTEQFTSAATATSSATSSKDEEHKDVVPPTPVAPPLTQDSDAVLTLYAVTGIAQDATARTIKGGFGAAAAADDPSLEAQTAPEQITGTAQDDKIFADNPDTTPPGTMVRVVDIVVTPPIETAVATTMRISGLPDSMWLDGATKDGSDWLLTLDPSQPNHVEFVLHYTLPPDGATPDGSGLYERSPTTITFVFDPASGAGNLVMSQTFAVGEVNSEADVYRTNPATGETTIVLSTRPPGNIIDAGEGDDTIYAALGKDTVDGGGGVNMLSYALSTSQVGVAVNLKTGEASRGYAEGDTFVNIQNLEGSKFSDELRGDDGDNLLRGGESGDFLDGGDGYDTADYSTARGPVALDLKAGKGTLGEAAGDTLRNFERVVGSDFSDDITGDDNANELVGGRGNDTLAGGLGADRLDGGEGSDTASYLPSQQGVVVRLGEGAVAGFGTGGDADGDVFVSIENLIGSTHDDELYGTSAANTLSGAAGDDLIEGKGGADTLSGGAGIEKLATEQGDLRRTLGSAHYTLAELPEILRQEFLLLRTGLDEAIDRAVGRVDEALSRERSVMEIRLNEHQFGLTRIGQTMTNTLETELNLLSRTLERMRSSLDDRANKVDSVHQDILSAMRGLDSRAEMKDELRAVAKSLETTLGGSVGALAHAMNEAMAGVAASIEHFSGDQEATARKLDSLNDARLASQELRALAHAMETGLSTGFGEISRALAAVTHFSQQAGRSAELATEPFSPTPPPQPVQAEEPAQKLDRMAAVEEFYANARRRMSNGG